MGRYGLRLVSRAAIEAKAAEKRQVSTSRARLAVVVRARNPPRLIFFSSPCVLLSFREALRGLGLRAFLALKPTQICGIPKGVRASFSF